MARVFVGMSGGVDSSAAALLLQRQGHAVEGIHLQLLGGLPLPLGSATPAAEDEEKPDENQTTAFDAETAEVQE